MTITPRIKKFGAITLVIVLASVGMPIYQNCMGEFSGRLQQLMDEWELCRTDIERWLARNDANDWLTQHYMVHIWCTAPFQAKVAVLIMPFPKCAAFPMSSVVPLEPRYPWA